MKPAVIIPVLNEVENIDSVISRIFRQDLNIDIIIVDGGSTDGTIDIVKKCKKENSQISLLFQEDKFGFGKGLCMGFKAAIEKNCDPILTMDGNSSHDPKYLKNFIKIHSQYDLIIGSRYLNGVRVEGWRFRTLLLSKLANMFVSYLLIKPIWDFTSGYRCYRRSFLERVNMEILYNEGYIIQIQLLYLAYLNSLRVKEIPFTFQGNKWKESKIAPHSRLKTLLYVLRCRAPISEILRHSFYLKKDYSRFVDEYEELLNPPNLKDIGKFRKSRFSISVGVMAYNEEKIIGQCLNALLNQQLRTGTINKIFVVSSGSTDKTNQIVQGYSKSDNRVKLIAQQVRSGKAAAINEFLDVAQGDIAVVESADTVPTSNAIEELIRPFSDPQVGMTGAHPVPLNDIQGFVGFCVHKIWELHHHIALDSPKCGEMIAFRNIVAKIPKYTAVDEATIEGIIRRQNLNLAYAENAIVYNKGPETVKDFIRQRRRIASGHRHLRVTTQHEVSTQKPGNLLRYVIANQRWTPKEILYMLVLMLIEAYSRFMGMIDFYLKDKNPYIWDISKTTKKI